MQLSKKNNITSASESILYRKSRKTAYRHSKLPNPELYLKNYWIQKLETYKKECIQMQILLNHQTARRIDLQRQKFLIQLHQFKSVDIPKLMEYIRSISRAEVDSWKYQNAGIQSAFTVKPIRLAQFESDLEDLRSNVWSFLTDAWPVSFV